MAKIGQIAAHLGCRYAGIFGQLIRGDKTRLFKTIRHTEEKLINIAKTIDKEAKRVNAP